MKKRLFALILAATMTMGMSMTAMAEEKTGTFKKAYTSESQVYPTETLSFSVSPAVEDAKNGPIVTVEDQSVTGAANAQNITYKIVVTDETPANVYTYNITENGGDTAGVTYGEETVVLLVLVNDDHSFTHGLAKKVGTNEKQDTITNVYEVGSFTVEKELTGNILTNADRNTKFTIHVKLTSAKEIAGNIMVGDSTVLATEWDNSTGSYVYETDCVISDNDPATTFANIPYGVSVEVTEPNVPAGYTDETTDTVNIIVDEQLNPDDARIIITNNKATTIDTGINVNNLPYILVLAGVAIAAVVLIRRKRYSAM